MGGRLLKIVGVAAAGLMTLGLGALAMAADAPTPQQQQQWMRNFTPDPALGEKVYAARCAACHDNATERTPPKAALEQNTPSYLMSVLRDGVMRPMTEGLSRQEVASVAAYLSKQPGGGVTTAATDAPLCEGKPAPLSFDGPQWNGWGAGGANPRFQPNPGLNAGDVPRLKVKWAFHYAGDRNGQATILGGRLFTTSMSGAVYSLDAKTGCVHWRFNADAGVRTTVTIARLPDTPTGRPVAYFVDRARQAYAIDADTGEVIWKTLVDTQGGVQMTGSPTLYGGKLFVPVSSAEEAIATNDNYECCKFRGNVVAVDAVTGKVLWKTYTTAVEPKPFRKNAKGVQMYGPAGGAIWSAPTIDAKRGVIYVATGDSYTDVPYDGSDAIIAMDMQTGAIRWVHQLTENDNYIIGCNRAPRPANCPEGPVGGDYDFGASPILHDLPNGKQVILAGQKSSEVYALDPDQKGKIIWKHRLSVGGPLGGVEFGPAADRENIYVGIADIFMRDAARPGMTAIRISDGKILWNTPSPRKDTCLWGKNIYCDPSISQAVSAMPGVVFAGAMDGRFRAYSTTDGKVIWEFDTASSYETLSGRTVDGGALDAAGPTIAGGMVYLHTGYAGRSNNAGNVLVAFSVDGK